MDKTLENFINICDEMMIAEEGVLNNAWNGIKNIIRIIVNIFEKIIDVIKNTGASISAFINKNKSKFDLFNLQNKPVQKMLSKIENFEITENSIATEATSLATYNQVKLDLAKRFKTASKLEMSANNFMMKFYNVYETMLDAFNKDIDDCVNEIIKAMKSDNYQLKETDNYETLVKASGMEFIETNKDFVALTDKMSADNPQNVGDYIKYAKPLIEVSCKNLRAIGKEYSLATTSKNSSAIVNACVDIIQSLGEAVGTLSDKDIFRSKTELLKVAGNIGLRSINPLKIVAKSVELGLFVKDTGVYAVKFSKASSKALNTMKQIERHIDTVGVKNPEEVSVLLNRLKKYALFSPKKYVDMMASVINGTFKITNIENILNNN